MNKKEFKDIWRRSIYYKSRCGIKEKATFISDFMLCDERTAVSLIPYLDE